MSQTVDNRVVEMRFDNQQFEAGVNKSMSTIDKLKKSLNFDDSAKSFDAIEKAASKVSFSSLSDSITQVRENISFLEVFVHETFERISNSIISTASNVLNTFTIEPISAGFSEYELKMSSIQTIMAATGASLDDVNGYLNELNEYSDKTIYSFSDMTNNIGKFTNAGVELDVAVKAMKGISNEAALSGANANEASRAMYNLAQSISMGYVQLIDWKSIENANMATVNFKENLAATGVELGVLTQEGDNYVTSTGKAYTLQQLFKDGLQEQWLTTDVLLGTLTEYADETTELGQKAYSAAQDVKTFTMMMDTLKESAQSGWVETWELIVGNYLDAKVMWTELANFFGDIIGKVADFRNSLLGGALNAQWDDFSDTLESVGVEFEDFQDAVDKLLSESEGDKLEDLIAKYGSFKGAIDNGAISADTLKEALHSLSFTQKEATTSTTTMAASYWDTIMVIRDVMNGVYGEGEERINKLTEAGYNYVDVLKLVEAKESGGHLWRTDVEAAQILLCTDAIEENAEATEELGESADETSEKLDGMLDELATKRSGRILLVETLRNALYSLRDVVTSVMLAWSDVFAPVTSEDIYKIIVAIHDFVESLTVTDEIASNIQNAFRGIFTVLKMVLSVATKVAGVVVKVLGAGIYVLGDAILTATSYIGDLIYSFSEWVKNSKFVNSFIERFRKIVEDIIPALKNFAAIVKDKVVSSINECIDAFNDIVESFKSSDNFSKVSELFEDIGYNISKMYRRIRTALGQIKGATSMEELMDILSSASSSISGSMAKIRQAIASITSMSFPEIDFTAFVEKFKSIFHIFKKDDSEEAADGFKDMTDTMSKMATAGEKLSDAVDSIKGFSLNGVLEKVSTFFQSIGDFIKQKININKDTILGALDLAREVVGIILGFKAVNTANSIAESLKSLTGSLSNLANSKKQEAKKEKWEAVGDAFKAAAVALLALAAAVYIINYIGVEESINAAGVVIGLLLAMTIMMGLILGMSKLTGGGFNTAATAGALIATAAALCLMVAAIQKVVALTTGDDALTDAQLWHGLIYVFGMMVALAVAVRVAGGASKGSVKSAALILSLLKALEQMLSLIIRYNNFNWSANEKGLKAILQMIAVLAVVVRFMGATGGKGAGALGGALSLLAVLVALKALLYIIEDYAKIGKGKLVRGGLAVTAMMALLVAFNYSLQFLKGVKAGTALASMVGLSLVLVVMSGVVKSLGALSVAEIIKGGIALTAMVGLIRAFMFSLSSLKGVKMGTAIVALVGFAFILAEMAFIIKMMTKIPVEQSKGSAEAIRTMLIGMAIVMAACALLGKYSATAVKAVGVMALIGLIVLAIAGIMILLKDINAGRMLVQVIAISILLAVMTSVAGACALIGPVAGAAIVGIGVVALLVIALADLLWLFGTAFSTEENLAKIERGSEIMGLIGEALGNFLGGIIGKTIEKLSEGIKNTGDNLQAFADSISGMFTTLDGVGILDITKVKLLIETIKELSEVKIKNFKISKVGTELTKFMENAGGFFDAISLIPDNVIDNIYKLGQTITAVSEAVATNASIKEEKREEGEDAIWGQLRDLINNMVMLDADLKGYNLDYDSLSTGISTMSELVGLINSMPQVDLIDIWTSTDSEQFATDITALGRALKAYSVSVKRIDTDAIGVSISAVGDLKTMSDTLPEYSAWEKIFGKSDMTTFSKGITALGNAIVEYSAAVSAEGAIDTDKIKTSIDAIELLIPLNEKLPEYSAWEKIFGKSDMTTFSKGITALGEAVVEFSDVIAGINVTRMNLLVPFIMDVVNQIVTINTSSTNGYDIDDFNESFGDLGEELSDFFDNVKPIDISKMSGILSIANRYNDFMTGLSTNTSGVSEFVTGMNELSGINGNTTFTAASELGNSISDSIASGVTDNSSSILDALKEAIQDAIDELEILCKEAGDFYEQMRLIGRYTMDGFIKGVNDRQGAVFTKLVWIMKQAILVAKEELKVNSPSKEFMKLGRSVDEGFVKGIDQESGSVLKSSSTLAQDVINSAAGAMTGLSKAINSGSDISPSITPVVDMSNIKATGLKIDSGLNVSLSGGIHSISKLVTDAQLSINESNQQVVSAISGLKTDLDAINGSLSNRETALYVDSKKLASSIATPMNRQLNILSKRGAYV